MAAGYFDKSFDPEDTQYDRYLKKMSKRRWSLKRDMPFYKTGKKPSWQDYDYNDFYSRAVGRECGSNGIGKLVEVGLPRLMEEEVDHLKWSMKQDPSFNFFPIDNPPDWRRWQKQHEAYYDILKENVPNVYVIDYPKPPVGPFGPWVYTWTPEIFIIKGGAIYHKFGFGPLMAGRSEYLARWLFWYLGLPPILAILGKGVCEPAAGVWLAQDCYVGMLSIAGNREGWNQVIPVMQKTAGVEKLNVLLNKPNCAHYMDIETGICAHTDMILNALDIGKVIIYPPSVDPGTRLWLKRRGFEFIEVTKEEHMKGWPCNLTTLRPGRVVMHSEAKDVIRRVRKAGVDVIELEYSEFLKTGGGLHCTTMLIRREDGPSLRDIK